MDRTERFYKICQLLESRRIVTRQEFLQSLEVSLATFKRDLEYLRDRYNAPITWDREKGGYCFDTWPGKDGKFQLPGLWFNESEVHALLIMEHLLENLNPGLLEPHISPLRTQIRALLDKSDHAVDKIKDKIRLLPLASRSYKLDTFEIVCQGLLAERKLAIRQYSRQRDEYTQRDISPQRLVHYRDNWYLDAYCHLRKDLRTFAVDTIREARILTSSAKKISARKLDEHLKAGYGIFSGRNTHVALLRFTPERARWVSRETWHPDQVSRYDKDGSYLLEIPYSSEHELVMDILKYGPDVKVESPSALAKAVRARVKETLARYA